MPSGDLANDLLLQQVPVYEGYKVLGSVVLYQKLGQGGMGAVYRGKHLRLNVDVAIKVMAPPMNVSPAQSDNYVRRFLREAQVAATINHTNLIRVVDVNSEYGLYFLVMDYVDGESAGDRLKRRKILSEQEAVEIILGAAQGLAEAHAQGIVHRDVKPDNIMIDKKGRVRVTDLGLAKAVAGDTDTNEPSVLTGTQQAMGTPYYMAPEQFVNARDVGTAADVWSLGVTLYQLLTGKLPWTDTSIFTLAVKIQNEPPEETKQVRPELSDGLCNIIRKALAKPLVERYANCGDMASALQEHLTVLPSTDQTVLPDEAAGSAKSLAGTMTPPPSKTLTMIGQSLVAALPGSPVPQEARPRWIVPVAAGGAVLASALGLWALFGRGTGTGQPPEDGIVVEVDAEADAKAFLEKILTAVSEDRLEDADRMVKKADASYFATESGPKIASLADTIARKLSARERQVGEKFKKLVSDSERAEADGEYAKALELVGRARAIRDDEALKSRASQLEQWLEARSRIADGVRFHAAGDLKRAMDAFEAALPLASEADALKVREWLARLQVERVIGEATMLADEAEWRSVWTLVSDSMAAGVSDERLSELAKRAARALAPPKELTGPIGVELVLVPGGEFTMGADDGGDGEAPAHTVKVSGFYIGRVEVTKSQFEAFKKGEADKLPPAGDGGREPAMEVTWDEANAFCKYLSSHDKTPGDAKATYRLPTEAEWEFAARGSEGRTYPWGNALPDEKRANLGAQVDPKGSPEGTKRVIRGSAFAYPAKVWSRASVRAVAAPEGRKDTIGFRVVRELFKEEAQFERAARGE